MEEIKKTVAHNLIVLRKNAHWTQAELAEKLNYSDKAISKWERGEAIPDILVLKQIAELFNVSVDDLTKEVDVQSLVVKKQKNNFSTKTKWFIEILSFLVVWFIATIVFVVLKLLPEDIGRAWLAFIYAIPVSFIVLLVYSCVWGNFLYRCIMVSLIAWSTCLSICLSFLDNDLWLMFIICIPFQIITVIWFCFRQFKLMEKLRR